MSVTNDKANDVPLNIQKIEYFPSGSLSSFQASIDYSEEENEIDFNGQIKHQKLNLVDYEQRSMKSSHGKKEDGNVLEAYEKALSKIQSLEQALKQSQMQLIKNDDEESLKRKLNAVIKENKELKNELIVQTNRLNLIEKTLKESKSKLKTVEKQKNFLYCQIKVICSKVLSANRSEKIRIDSKELFEDQFYLTVFEKIDDLLRSKKRTQGVEIFTPSVLLSPVKVFEDSNEKISLGLQTEPDLESFRQKYWNLRYFEKSIGTKDKIEKCENSSKSEETMKVNETENFSYKNVFKDLKEIGTLSVKGNQKFDFGKNKSMSVKTLMDSKLGLRNQEVFINKCLH